MAKLKALILMMFKQMTFVLMTFEPMTFEQMTFVLVTFEQLAQHLIFVLSTQMAHLRKMSYYKICIVHVDIERHLSERHSSDATENKIYNKGAGK